MPAAFRPEATRLQRLADHLLFPINMWLSEESSARLGLTPIDHERIRMALRQCRGRLLDVGCGSNLLVRLHGHGVGCDVHPYPEADVRCDSALLPFAGGSFDTVALLACLNHITRRGETLRECRRVLRPGGRVVVSMIPRWVGAVSHPVRKPHDPDQRDRGMGRDEAPGLSVREVTRLLATAGFKVVLRQRFMWGLNGLFVGELDG
jgi:SAM-dependent methyltransferase